MKNTTAEAKVEIDFPTESDAEAMTRALIPETTVPRTTRAHVRVTRQRKVTKMVFHSRDLIALRAMVNSYLRFAATWRKVSETLRVSQRRTERVRTHHREVG